MLRLFADRGLLFVWNSPPARFPLSDYIEYRTYNSLETLIDRLCKMARQQTDRKVWENGRIPNAILLHADLKDRAE